MFRFILRTSEILILSALIVGVANSCPDGNDVYPCALRDLPGVNCTYKKGLPDGGVPVTDDINCPAAVKNLSVGFISAPIDKSCETRFNITWKINRDGSAQYFTGFLLNITFLNDGIMRNILRTFRLSVANWSVIPFSETSFRHECVVPFPNTSYHIEVLSLPYSAKANSRFPIDYRTSEFFDTTAPCLVASNPNITFNWTATVLIEQNVEESSIGICFYLAPDAFGFTQYRVTFQLENAKQLDEPAGQTVLYANTSKDRQLCVTFGNICPGIYKVWVMPVNIPFGTCRNGSEEKGACDASEVNPVDMTSSVCNPAFTTSVLSSTGRVDNTQPVIYPVYPGSQPVLASTGREDTTQPGFYPVHLDNEPVTQPGPTVSNPNITFNWTATVGTSINLAESSIGICFYLAPDAFGFTQYRVTFQLQDAGQLDEPAGQTVLYANTSKDRQLCVKFWNICPGIYKVWVMPMNIPLGTCRNGSEVKGSCAASEVKSVDMTSSVCNPASTTSVLSSTGRVIYPVYPDSQPISQPVLVSTSREDTTQPAIYPVHLDNEPVTQPGSLDSVKIAGIVIGLCLAVGIVIVVIHLILRPPRKRNLFNSFNSDTVKDPIFGPEIRVDKPQSVLIIYSTDSEAHRKVVRKFAAFLHSCCKCDVRYDEWSQVEISQTNPIDWFTKQLRQVKHVIIINSEGGFMQHRGWVDNTQYVLVKDLLLPDLFIPAVRQIQTQYFLNKQELHYYHVSFPYTDQKYLLNTSFGKRYKLMDHIEDLFLNIHGMTKFSSKGTTFANQIKREEYANSLEGQALQAAINEAREYVDGNSGWFKQHYRQSKLTEDANSVHLSCDNDAAAIVAFTSSCNSLETKNQSKTSDLDANSIGVGSFPPSPDSSCIGDVEHHSFSPDVGIGCMLEDYMFDQTASRIILCAPSFDDDNSSIGSRSFTAKISEWNEQYDSGLPLSSFELKSNSSSC